MNYSFLALGAANPGLLPLAFMPSGSISSHGLAEGADSDFYGRFMAYSMKATGWRSWMCNAVALFGAFVVMALLMGITAFGIVAWSIALEFFALKWIAIAVALGADAVAAYCFSMVLKIWVDLMY